MGIRRSPHSLRALVVALAFLALLAGCAEPALQDPARVGPFFVPRNVAADRTLGGIRRVVLMPVWAPEAAPEETAAELDRIVGKALQDQNRFEVVAFSREACRRRFGRAAVGTVEPLPRDLMPTLQRLYAADALLFVDVTTYRAYHPLALGLRGRLVLMADLRTVWSFDNVFSADQPDVAAAARHFFLGSDHGGVPGDLTPAVLQSPSRYAAYATDAMFATLPPVTRTPIAQLFPR